MPTRINPVIAHKENMAVLVANVQGYCSIHGAVSTASFDCPECKEAFKVVALPIPAPTTTAFKSSVLPSELQSE